MSQITDQATECAHAAIEQCRSLLAFGPLMTPEQIYETAELLLYTGSNLMGLKHRLKEARKAQAPDGHKPESPAMADLCGRQ